MFLQIDAELMLNIS